PGLVPPPLAQSTRDGGALHGAARPPPPGALVHLPAPNVAHAGVGDDPARARPPDSSAPRRPRRRDAPRPPVVRAARLLRPRGPRLCPAEPATLGRAECTIHFSFAGALALTLLARAGRRAYTRRWRAIRIRYPGGREVLVPIGFSILEASRFAQLPHASVCGGRGRCSTCRVQILFGGDGIPAPSADELRVLERVGAPPGVRLACQARPTGDVAVRPLLPATARASE